MKFDADHAGYLISKIKDTIYDIQSGITDISEDVDLENGMYQLTLYISDGYEDSAKIVYAINLSDIVDDELDEDMDALEKYLDEHSSYISYDDLASEYYTKAQKALEDKFGCVNAYLEPSTQSGMGGVFLFSDNMMFTGNFDFETSEEYIRDENLDAFIQLALESFTPYNDEDDEDDNVYAGNANGISTEEDGE